MMSRVAGLGTRFPLALVLSAALSLLAGQSVGSRWFGGVRRVPLAQSQLPFQIGDLLLSIGDPLLAFDQLIAELLNLLLLSLDSSVITSKPATRDHFKTGHLNLTQDGDFLLPCHPYSGNQE
jgi:hypothetical protein